MTTRAGSSLPGRGAAVAALALVLVVGVAGACSSSAPPPAQAPAADPAAVARSTAESFWTCYERNGAECRSPGAPYGAWAALRVLAFVRDASPINVLDQLPFALRGTEGDDPALRAFILELTTHEPRARNGACVVGETDRLAPDGIAEFLRAARARADNLGLFGTGLGPKIEDLIPRVAPFASAFVVHFECVRGGGNFYVVLAAVDGGYQVVSLQTVRPGIDPPSRPAVLPELVPIEGSISPYIPVTEDAL